MNRRGLSWSVVIVLGVVLLVVSGVAAGSSAPKLSLKAAPTKCKVGTSVKFTVKVTSVKPAYEVRIYKTTSGTLSNVATATRVATGTYVAYVKTASVGKKYFKAGFVNSSGSVTAYSNSVTVTVTN